VLSPHWKNTSFVLSCLVFLLVHVKLSPFRSQVMALWFRLSSPCSLPTFPLIQQRDNWLETLSLLHLLALATLLTAESPPYRCSRSEDKGFCSTLLCVLDGSTGLEVVLSMVVLIPALAFLIYVLLDVLHNKFKVSFCFVHCGSGTCLPDLCVCVVPVDCIARSPVPKRACC
jgi:hypothetical protein